MIVGAIQTTSFGITTVKPYKKMYSTNSWNEISEGKYKDYDFTLYTNYDNGKKGPSMVIFRKFGMWIKSKIRYRDSENNLKFLEYHF